MSLLPDQKVQPKTRLALTPQMRMIVGFLSKDGARVAAETVRLGQTNPSIGVAYMPEGIARRTGLYEHASLWISANFDGDEQSFAMQFLDALEPWGWLGKPLVEICDAAEMDMPTGANILKRLQRIEPRGLFARSLGECLLLQVQADGSADPLMYRILENLRVFEAQGPKAMAAACKCSAQELASNLARLRQYDPKPGLQFEDAAPVPTGLPDLLLETHAGGLRIRIHPDAVPRFERLPTLDSEAAREADRFQKALEARQRTLLAIARRLVDVQRDHLTGGGALQPYAMSDLARDTGRHKSTISRVVQWATIETKDRRMSLKALLGPKLRRIGVAPDHLLAAITKLIETEDPAHGLSDSALTRALAQQGYSIARRTVAKYREVAQIPSARVRAATKRDQDAPKRSFKNPA